MADNQDFIAHNMFDTPLYVTHINGDFSDVAEHFIGQSKRTLGVEASNQGGWQSEDIRNNPIIADLLGEINNSCYGLFRGLFEGERLEITNIWVNVNQLTDHNVEHIHPFSIFSGVLFLKTPIGASPLNLYRDDSYIHYISGTKPKTISSAFEVSPEPNKLILFPSWIPHEVKRSDYDGERVSVAFNTRLVKTTGGE